VQRDRSQRSSAFKLCIQIITIIRISDVVAVLQNNTEQGRSKIGTSPLYGIPFLMIVSLISGEKDLVQKD